MNISWHSSVRFSDDFVNSLPRQGKGATLEKIATQIDDYLSILFSKKFVVIKEQPLGSGVYCFRYKSEKAGYGKVIWKLLSYFLIIPLLIALILKVIVMFLLSIKYPSIQCISLEQLKSQLRYFEDEYFLPPLDAKHAQILVNKHKEIRFSGKTRKELKELGLLMHSVSDDPDLQDFPFFEDEMIVFFLKEFPGLTFQSIQSSTRFSIEDKGPKEFCSEVHAIETWKTDFSHIIRYGLEHTLVTNPDHMMHYTLVAAETWSFPNE
ncbi:hypothetical protein [Chlamydia vaughanii]|uniref:hypothetical protein n=1 Tax=Chlamydia vaughanii TaxID=3112552 RepID=UPI0032B28BF7